MSAYPLTKVKEFRLKLFPKDFYKVKDFYEKTLGYPITDSWDGDKSKGVMFDTGVAIIELLTPKTGYVNLQGSNIALMVDDIWKLWEKLKSHPNIVMPLTERPWGDVSFRITDPEGFQISFFTQKKVKYNSIHKT